MGIGFVVAASSLPVAILVLGYLVATLSAAMRSEERWLQERFGAAYDDYCAGRMRPTDRQFELSRVVANRELRAVMGLLVIIAVLALKAQ